MPPLRLMPPHLRRLSSRELLLALGRLGFEVVATRGGHAKLRRLAPDGALQVEGGRQTLTVPMHRELAQIERDGVPLACWIALNRPT
jgi:predicted RNA binding protein YcfA (HicA-like mRNA interferase family)